MSRKWSVASRVGGHQYLYPQCAREEKAWCKVHLPGHKTSKHLSAILYVNNTDIIHIDLTQNETVDEVHRRIQESVDSWGNLLIATGGALQPAKSFYSIISFEWDRGAWRYTSNESKAELGIRVPLPGGGSAGIGHKSVLHAEKTLGAMTSSDGNCREAIRMMQDKAQQWVNDVWNGKLHHRNVWFLLKFQLRPRIIYGLCSSTATFDELSNAMQQQYYQILPLGGVVRTTAIVSRTIDPGFYGIGLPNLGVEALVAMSNKLLMHYGCDTATGQFMRASHSLFLLELGILLQPLQESCSKYSFLLTHSWMKMLWEKISKFGVRTVIADTGITHPREGDQFIMQAFFERGYPQDILSRLNQVRILWQALFLSDIFAVSGQILDQEVVGQHNSQRNRSQLQRPLKHPTELDFQLWKDAVSALCPSRTNERGWDHSLYQHTGYGIGGGTRAPGAYAIQAMMERQRTCSGGRKSQTGSTTRRRGHTQDGDSSARRSQHTRGQWEEDGD